MGKKVLIVGGVAGGASTAARLRRVDEEAEIIMFERGEHISFANCGLPYHIGEIIPERDKLLVQTPEGMESRFNVDVRVMSEVISIDRDNREIKVKNHKSGETYTESYDKLVLSPGAHPIQPPIPGIDHKNIYTLRNIPDMDKIKEHVVEQNAKSAIVVGGGFIGIEMAENLEHQDLDVTLVEMADQIMGPVDFEMAALLHEHIRANGVNLILKDGVKAFSDKSGQIEVTLQSGKKVTADMIVMAIGVKPEVKLAEEAGLELGELGGIKVNDHLQTSDPSIYALGDAIEVEDFVTGNRTHIPLAGPANKQGRIVANNIIGREETYKGTQGTSVAKVFDLTVTSTGANEKTLQREGIDYITSFTTSKNHAGYYPGAMPMTVKVIYTPEEGKLLGAQIVGYEGVDKRIDVLATALRFNKTVFDLQELELAYAPPFGSAKDPVNMAGFAAGNIINGDSDIIQWHEIADLDLNKTAILDIRTRMEHELGAIEGSINIPVDELRDRIDEIPGDKDLVVYCKVGLRGYVGERILRQHGFKNIRNLTGGYSLYSVANKERDIVDGNEIPSSPDGVPPCCDNSEGVEKEVKPKKVDLENEETIKLDACGLQCPGPIMQVYQKMETLNEGDILEVKATDPGFVADVASWCDSTGNTLLKQDKADNSFIAFIQKGTLDESNQVAEIPKDKTIVVFSGELDKAIASFIIANGAASMGRKVTLFFTFWGLNILRKNEKVKGVKKGFLDKMFGMMMPRGSKKLGLSRMNMGGMGSKMIRGVMEKKGVDSLEDLIKQAKFAGVRLVACQMSMDVMGIKKEELIDGVEIGGVASFLGAADNSNMSLFI